MFSADKLAKEHPFSVQVLLLNYNKASAFFPQFNIP